MLVAALVVGAVTAFYFGLRAGAAAAGVALALFAVAEVRPGAALWAYGLVAAGLVGVCTIGPKRQNPTHAARVTRWARRGLGELRRRLGGLGGSSGDRKPGARP